MDGTSGISGIGGFLRAQQIQQFAVANQLLVDAELTVRGAGALHLAALHGKDGVGGALVALDDAKPGAEHVIEHGRQDAERGAGPGAANDELLRKKIRWGFDRGGDPTHAYACRQRCRAQPVETPRIGLDVHLAHQGLARHVAGKRSEHRAVAGRLCVEKISRGDARRRRHVLHDDGGLPGNVLAEVSREEPSGKVVVVAYGMPDDHADLLVLVELLRSLSARAEGDTEGETERDDRFAGRH